MLLLIFLFGLRLLLNATFSRAAPPSSQDRCRCLFGDACWPSTDDFASLQKQVSQPLLHPLPPASPCYPISHPSGDCDEVHQQWTNASWRAHQPGAMQGENFETFVFSNGTTSACFMDTSLGVPCTQGSVPVIGVDARDDVDLQAAVRFAASHNLRLVVKGTGHDLSGRSTARGSFIIWTHNMKNITFHDTFTPEGAPESDVHDHAITLGSGVQWQEAYEAVNAKNRVLVGGLSAGGTVGAAGGWVLGGGHSVLSPSFGLGVDNALQFTMISSNGTRYVANAYQYADLFFALRGGGGGTYGVVTSVTYQTHPNLPLIAAAFATSTNSTTPNAPLETLFSDLIHLTPELSDAGWSGFFSLAPDPTTGALGLSGFFVMLNGTLDRANEDLGRFFSTAQSLANASDNALTVQTSFITPVESFFTWYQNFFPQTSSAGSNGAIGSWLLPRDVIEQDPDRVVKTLLPLTILSISMVGGGAVSAVSPHAMGVNPAWRKTLLHTIFATGWVEGTPVNVINQLVDTLKQNLTTLRALAPESGAYFNEASLFEPDPQRAFFGDNRFKLKTIKQKYDPISLFVVNEGIGSDDWDADLVCRID